MMRTVRLSLSLVVVCLGGCLDTSSNQELTGREAEVARAGFNDALRSARLADVDVAALAGRVTPGAVVSLALPGLDRADLVVGSVQQLVPGVTTFTGHLAGDEGSDFAFSIEDGALVGSVRQGPQAWLVAPHASGQHVVREIDRTALPRDPEHATHAMQRRAQTTTGGATAEPALTTATNANGNVRVLFLHATDVANASSHAANIVASFNQSLSASLVSSNNTITLVGVQQVNSDFDNQSRQMIMNDMVANSGPFVGLDAALDANYADVAFLLVQEDADAAGEWPQWGRVGGAAMPFVRDDPFAMSTLNYALGDLTALHELGHVFGGRHEEVPPEIAGIARPVVAPDCSWMTIMGGYIWCQFNGLPATTVRLGRWSNPEQTWNGIPLGVAGQRDMESHLETAMPAASNWRPEPPSVQPAVMSSPTPGTQLPGSSVTFSWTTGSSILQYYLYVGNGPGGYDLYNASQGTSTSGTVHNLPTDGRTLHVRLWSYSNALGWQARDYTYTAANIVTPAVMWSPSPGSTLPGSTATFYWSTGTGVSQYYLYVGSSPGWADYYGASQGAATSGTVYNLPTDGRTLYVRLWSYTNQGWLFRDYWYQAHSSCVPHTGQHGQLWTTVGANAQWQYNQGWCTVGRGLPQQCWEGTYYYYQDVQGSYCTSGGSTGSCYDGDAWWWVTCNALVDCVYDCYGNCVQASC